MTCTNRTITALILLSLPFPGVNQAAQSQERAGVGASEKTFIISGTTGVSGVSIRGLPGAITDNKGVYAARVRYGWSGTVTPTKEGFSFEPPSREYARVTDDCSNQDYVAKVLTFTISGMTGVSGVRMLGLPGVSISDENGAYAAIVPYGWAGNVVPNKEGYSFEPIRKEYSTVTADLRSEDYKAQPRMVYISGWMRAGIEPIEEVKVTADPGGQSVLTDLHGRYALQVPYGWTGRLIFSKGRFVFDPDSRSFTNVTTDIIGEEPAPSGKRPTPPSRTQVYPRAVLPIPAGNVFVIPMAQVAPQKLAETADDLRVMLQIFREKLSEPRLIRGAFVDFGDFFSDRDRALEAFYLQGSAAVFVLEMDAPFTFAPVPPGRGEAEKEAVDPVWQRARQRLTSPQNPLGGMAGGRPGETEKMDFRQFHEDLLQTLRHAANLRNVEPDESVIVSIIAHDESGTWPGRASAGGPYGVAGGSTYADSRTRSSGSVVDRTTSGRVGTGAAPAAPATVLTIQAKKADINAFAGGGLSFEQFQQRVKTFTY